MCELICGMWIKSHVLQQLAILFSHVDWIVATSYSVLTRGLDLRIQSLNSALSKVLIVDDGIKDRTSKVAFNFVRKYKIDNVRVMLLGRNHGKAEAIRKGMLHSRGELLLMLDADRATKVTDLEKLETHVLGTETLSCIWVYGEQLIFAFMLIRQCSIGNLVYIGGP
ncbi:dolichyl-phosphate beta-glucosyltransferase-like [Asparagus officinalis]|uniref:dolichyl-phosphate beta-glucosyltransferase-like n=1 Tax=Asparagus officinalis TaxID=4686 RepID=UPI00098E0ADE|nr:dolichyl-phosphate beta-glucosyltransferase-like [Asparagus officinalis]